jgi:CheY-like chemotaxis protein
MSTVLVVEDSLAQRECISNQLQWSGLDVIEACDGIDALEKIQTNNPDLILLDIVMPRMDGYGVCRLLKANPETQNIPVVFLTARVQNFDLSWGLKNAEAYLGKPWRPKELINTIKRLILNNNHLRVTASADSWTQYGILLVNTIELYECRADAWTKYGRQITLFYDYALAAFAQALTLESNHAVATKYRDNVQKKWDILLEKLEQTQPCRLCQYYHGKEGINCAIHPLARPGENCRDWEFERHIVQGIGKDI